MGCCLRHVRRGILRLGLENILVRIRILVLILRNRFRRRRQRTCQLPRERAHRLISQGIFEFEEVFEQAGGFDAGDDGAFGDVINLAGDAEIVAEDLVGAEDDEMGTLIRAVF